MGVNCDLPPAYHCPDEACERGSTPQPGDTVEMKTRRFYFLDCPKGVTPGQKVNILLSLHGGGSYANWRRNYFPGIDVKHKYNLVIITPGSPTRTWSEPACADCGAGWFAGPGRSCAGGGPRSRRIVGP